MVITIPLFRQHVNAQYAAPQPGTYDQKRKTAPLARRGFLSGIFLSCQERDETALAKSAAY